MSVVGADGKPVTKKVGIVVQVRQESKRLPGKWKAEIDGVPMIEWVSSRAFQTLQNCAVFFKNAPLAFKLIFAIPKGDDDLKKWLKEKEYEVSAGS